MESMKTVYIIILLSIITLVPSAFGEIKTFTKEYTYEASELDSKSTSRIYALEHVKRLLLEELTDLLNSQSNSVASQLTKDQITSITAGIVSADILDEKWDEQQYWLKAKIEANTSIIQEAIKIIRSDALMASDLEATQKRIEIFTKQLESLKKDPGNILKDRQLAYNAITDRIKASSMMQEYYQLKLNGKASMHELINILSIIIELDQTIAKAYYDRAELYFIRNELTKAESDYQNIVRLKYYPVYAYSKLADIYYKNSELMKFVEYKYLYLNNSDSIEIEKGLSDNISINDYNKIIKKYPTSYKAYLLRGYKRITELIGNSTHNDFKQKPQPIDIRITKDINKSLNLNKQQPIAYLLLALLNKELLKYNIEDDKYKTIINNIINYCTLGLTNFPSDYIAAKLLRMRVIYGSRTRDCELTARDYENIISIESAKTSINNTSLSFDYEKLAEQNVACNKYNEAIYNYKKAIELSLKKNIPDNEYLFEYLGDIYKAVEDNDHAIDAYKNAIKSIDKKILNHTNADDKTLPLFTNAIRNLNAYKVKISNKIKSLGQ